jgi:nucleotide-binding universal stress UspA family protein
MKILFATDGSPRSLAALSTLVGMLDRFREPRDIVLLNVHPPLPYRGAAAWVGKEAIDRYYDEEGEAALAESRTLLGAAKVPFVAIKAVGEAAPEIVARATAQGCDFIAMGTQGHGSLANLMLGSVSTKVLALAAIPVLLLK